MDVPLGIKAFLPPGLDIPHQHGRQVARLRQFVQQLAVERAVASGAEGLAGATRILGHHVLVAAVFLALEVIPVDLLQRAAGIPQLVLIPVHRIPQRHGVIDRLDIHLDFVPGHKHRQLVAQFLLGPQPFVMEIVAHAIGR